MSIVRTETFRATSTDPCRPGLSLADPLLQEPFDSSWILEAMQSQEECEMSQTNRGRAQDRARVAAGQDHELRYEADKEGVSKADVKDAVHEVGNSRNKVEQKLEEGR
ncbi:conserved protein of unknown function [Pseudorhizobium banfieldiae]|uniref:DUF3606 domain-containing protein n=2 Tax=Pseudorhizobium banfieldiae TaxID=1125847 RepID=L0NGL6_9HYPH|nr:conserved protein of unknown function [Pseudorhizobium banfieldiae]